MSNPEPSTAKGAEAPQMEPLPCTFCGEEHVSVQEYDTKDAWWTVCDNIFCGAEGPTKQTKAEAIAAWNQRAPSDPKGTEQDSGEPGAERANTVPIPMEHSLKCWPQFFEPLLAGVKTFEVRKNDRDFKVGDILHLHEFDPYDGFSGRSAKREVTYILNGLGPAGGTQFGVERGYVVMGLAPSGPEATSGASAAGVSLPTSSAAQASVEGDDLILAEANKAADSITDCCKYALREFPSMRSDWTSIHKSLEAIVAASLLRVAQAVGSTDLGEPGAAITNAVSVPEMALHDVIMKGKALLHQLAQYASLGFKYDKEFQEFLTAIEKAEAPSVPNAPDKNMEEGE